MSGNDIKEAEALMHSAKKHTEKGLFKWKANWDEAANDYEKAAKIFTYIKNIEKARDAWLKASDAHERAGNQFFAARAMECLAAFLAEQAISNAGKGGNINKNNSISLLNEAIGTYDKACHLYVQENKFDKGADVITKAAQLINPTTASARSSENLLGFSEEQKRQNLKRVTDLFCFAVNTLEEHEEEQKVYAVRLPDIYSTWMLTYLRSGDIPNAVKVLKRELGFESSVSKKGVFERLGQPHNSAKLVLEVIVLCLSCGDIVWAQQEMGVLRNVPGFAGSREEVTVAALLDSFRERDVESLKDALKDQTLQFISAEVSKLAKKLKIQSTEASGAPHPNPHNQQQQEQQQQQQEPEIDPEEDIR
ncbi:putative Gamma-soluble NSF attachment protein [Trypanosoma theileri]|uniref:Gamma-soluble NSF attachment protein n=1 Tax=Trypanosoma theileri TaxID=67003 RepID=A0A1X0P9K4_9TRYP|nr:putative Gamma-soluble NSF attachment protein [Trypanosoma theileri]ORC93279.1 putative Gamma-soluble NSF attachment protein [Trypanosoma theileri]